MLKRRFWRAKSCTICPNWGEVGGGGRGNLGNARKKLIFLMGGVPLFYHFIMEKLDQNFHICLRPTPPPYGDRKKAVIFLLMTSLIQRHRSHVCAELDVEWSGLTLHSPVCWERAPSFIYNENSYLTYWCCFLYRPTGKAWWILTLQFPPKTTIKLIMLQQNVKYMCCVVFSIVAGQE